jgi:hypothetical protein
VAVMKRHSQWRRRHEGQLPTCPASPPTPEALRVITPASPAQEGDLFRSATDRKRDMPLASPPHPHRTAVDFSILASPTPSYSGSRLAAAAATPSAAAGGVDDLDDLFVAVDVPDHAGVTPNSASRSHGSHFDDDSSGSDDDDASAHEGVALPPHLRAVAKPKLIPFRSPTRRQSSLPPAPSPQDAAGSSASAPLAASDDGAHDVLSRL